MGIKSKGDARRLQSVFVSYMLWVGLSFFILLVLMVGGLILFINSSAIIPANASEKAIRQAQGALQGDQPFNPELVPEGCTYALFTKTGTLRQTNMDEKSLAEAKETALGGASGYPDNRFYDTIDRADGLLLIQYSLLARYRNPVLNQIFPSVELFLCLWIGVQMALALLIVVLIARCFGKRLGRELQPLMEATEAIKNEDLEYRHQSSGIVEFNEVLGSMDEMQEALRVSLKGQWQAEQERNDQINALTHDIKTPLTIIKGNAELLLEEPLSQDQQKGLKFIYDNAVIIQEYTGLLSHASKAQATWTLGLLSVDTKGFMGGFEQQAKGYGAVKKIDLSFRTAALPRSVTIDPSLLMRAMMNVVTNALDYTPVGGSCEVRVAAKGGTLVITVTDGGPGFSREALEKGAQKFYRGDKSRGGQGHYGLGLYITDTILRAHNGSLSLKNTEQGRHGHVVLTLPI